MADVFFIYLVDLDKFLRLLSKVENEASDHRFSPRLNAVVLQKYEIWNNLESECYDTKLTAILL